ncbi:MAG: hypothetical protein L0271_02100 [Gemmatimonadetes bacterium]|nr:hypothetical protein [Gemmatimonadota bacterium]
MTNTEYRTREDMLAGWPVRIVSYCVGPIWYAAVENVDPGAKIARANGDSREAAEQKAIEKARERLERTRR